MKDSKMQEAGMRPYFIWNADLTEEDVRQILATGSDYSRVQMMSTILHYARFNDNSFFAQPASAPFALHGGTALAAFYLQHRVSEDVDLFAVGFGSRYAQNVQAD